MELVLVQSLGFVLVIILGYTLKRKDVFKKEDGFTLAKIIMNITLPFSILTNAKDLHFDIIMVILLILGVLTNIIMIIISYLVSKNMHPNNKAAYIICCSGYNIGNFIMPVTQAFFPGIGVAYLCMFDIGNSIFCLGGSYAIASSITSDNKKIGIKPIFEKLKSSPPFITYLVIILLSVFEITIPENILIISRYIGGANGFLVMFMIGLIIEIKISKTEKEDICRILVIRYGMAVLFSVICYFILPLPILAKQILVLSFIAPLTTVSSVFSRQAGYTKDAPALANSVSIIISIVLSVILLLLFV